MIKRKWAMCLLMLLLIIPCFHIDTQAQVTDYICYEEESEGESGSDFITEAIKSIDENTAAQEANHDYMKNFYNSSLTASTESLNLFNPSTIVTVILNMFTYVLEIVGLCFTLFVMVVYNFSSSTFISGVVGDIISKIEKVVFDWSNPNSWIIKIVIIAALIGILYDLIKNFTKLRGYKQIIPIIAATVLSTSFIIFIGQNGRNIVTAVESKTKDMVVETFVFDGQSGNMEISTKENIFNILQKQPFMLRHFGVSSVEQLAKASNQSLAEATERVQTMLSDPGEDNAEKEYDEYQNQVICHDIGSAMFILFISLIELVHRFLMSLIIGILCITAGAIKLTKEMLLWLSIYQLIWWLIKRNHATQQWFTDRIMWSVLAISADILFSTLLYFLMQASAAISEIHPLLMIGFDVVLIILVKFLIKNIGTIMAKIKNNGGEMLKAVATGSPADVYRKLNKLKNPSHNNADESSDDESSDTDEDLSDADDDSYHDSDDLSDNEAVDDTFDDESGDDMYEHETSDQESDTESNQNNQDDTIDDTANHTLADVHKDTAKDEKEADIDDSPTEAEESAKDEEAAENETAAEEQDSSDSAADEEAPEEDLSDENDIMELDELSENDQTKESDFFDDDLTDEGDNDSADNTGEVDPAADHDLSDSESENVTETETDDSIIVEEDAENKENDTDQTEGALKFEAGTTDPVNESISQTNDDSLAADEIIINKADDEDSHETDLDNDVADNIDDSVMDSFKNNDIGNEADAEAAANTAPAEDNPADNDELEHKDHESDVNAEQNIKQTDTIEEKKNDSAVDSAVSTEMEAELSEDEVEVNSSILDAYESST